MCVAKTGPSTSSPSLSSPAVSAVVFSSQCNIRLHQSWLSHTLRSCYYWLQWVRSFLTGKLQQLVWRLSLWCYVNLVQRFICSVNGPVPIYSVYHVEVFDITESAVSTVIFLYGWYKCSGNLSASVGRMYVFYTWTDGWWRTHWSRKLTKPSCSSSPSSLSAVTQLHLTTSGRVRFHGHWYWRFDWCLPVVFLSVASGQVYVLQRSLTKETFTAQTWAFIHFWLDYYWSLLSCFPAIKVK